MDVRKVFSKPIYLTAIITVGVLLALVMVCQTATAVEGFQPGPYPASVDNPLLDGCYETTDYKGLQNISYANSSKNYPIFNASHCGTNNLRYWCRPMNGTCAPSEVCTNLYAPTRQKEWTQPPAPPYGAKHRVNFYIGKSMSDK